MKLNDRFCLQEYVSRETYEQHGDKCVRWISDTLIRADRALITALELYFNRPVSCTINSWVFGGDRQFSGLRRKGEPYFREYSLHSSGQASDKQFKFKDTGEPIATREVYDFIREHQDEFYALGVRRMEDIRDAPTWIHWDCCHTSEAFTDTIQIVRA